MSANPRQVAAGVLAQVLSEGQTLSQLLPKALSEVDKRDQALLQEFCFGTCRWYPRLKQIYLALIDKPLKAKDTDIEALIMLGLYQLCFTRVPAHAAIHDTVECAKRLRKAWAVKLINAILRNGQRQLDELLEQAQTSDQGRLAHPNWLIKAINKAWPEQAEAIFAANNQHPPFTLRVNAAQQSRAGYLQALAEAGIAATATPYSPWGVTLAQPTAVEQLPGFSQGWASVQDEAAQLAAGLMQLQPGQHVLDACAAPGGKTCHLLEVEPEISLVAVDISARRLQKVAENLNRIHPKRIGQVRLQASDLLAVEQWCQPGESFDRILLDAPCSATGVIRRHPDIKLLRLANQITQLSQLQLQLLQRLWPKLKPGGRLVYATCSIFPAENSQVIEQFLATEASAKLEPLSVAWGLPQPAGRQLLPQIGGHDGFFYAVLSKSTAA
ncbi:16S rRNA (cytosine(967)-C(5))-methyltransferase RsmB [Halioxenophilus sp. WMMB6]|uniref:16S rRNA (cytosine(967)-C(5))-methyltransferase RsmB n=1 Tax=Halioxenophilus sp. WMMB6 TaxID=3073815 RepID=UPI00295F594B|nr:16S rRNA (cytosine(967)-C(5))-methyltransferase RsmB [Halioxenophilus sp. WMMB6]